MIKEDQELRERLEQVRKELFEAAIRIREKTRGLTHFFRRTNMSKRAKCLKVFSSSLTGMTICFSSSMGYSAPSWPDGFCVPNLLWAARLPGEKPYR